MADVSKLKQRRTLGTPPPPAEASTNLMQPEMPEPGGVVGGTPPGPRNFAVEFGEARIDGRTLRRSNRVVQFATRVTPEFDRRVRAIAMREGLLIVEVLEQALDVYESKKQSSS